MAKDLAIILNSGSVNSAIVTALAMQKYRAVIVHGDDGQKPGSRLRAAYEQQISHFKPYREHKLAMAPIVASKSGAAAAIAADPRAPAALGMQFLELLPLMAAASRLAAHYQASAIYLGLRVGTQADDLAAATEFIQIWSELLNLPCNQPELEVIAPLLELEAWQAVDLGAQVSAPLDRTWSCDEEEAAEPCWACRGCRAREAAFQQAAKPDPLHGVRKI
jgi:7-cyano-7-deazaguanine synthase in queuosine biosynthesis